MANAEQRISFPEGVWQSAKKDIILFSISTSPQFEFPSVRELKKLEIVEGNSNSAPN